MQIEIQKQNTGYLITSKKYKLSFFGTNPRHDWSVVFFIGVLLLVSFSVLYYLENLSIKSLVSEDNLVIEEKKYFDIDKAEKLLKDFELRRNLVDQSL